MGPSLAGKPIPQIQWDAERDAKITARVKELLATNPEVKALNETNPYLAFRKAMAIAAKEIPPKGGGFGGGKGDVARSQGDAKLSRDERLQAVTLTLLKTVPELAEMAKSDSYGAFKLAMRVANKKLKALEREWAGKANLLPEGPVDPAIVEMIRAHLQRGGKRPAHIFNAGGLPVSA